MVKVLQLLIATVFSYPCAAIRKVFFPYMLLMLSSVPSFYCSFSVCFVKHSLLHFVCRNNFRNHYSCFLKIIPITVNYIQSLYCLFYYFSIAFVATGNCIFMLR